MRSPLSIGTTVYLNEIGTDHSIDFTITEVIGSGSGCIVYTAIHSDAEGNAFAVRLKEFYPDEPEIMRNADGSLQMDARSYKRALQRFSDGYRKQLQFCHLPASMNSVSHIQGVFEGNQTRYLAMSCQNGVCIEGAALSLYDSFRVLKAVTLQIQNFHDSGYLYLDLKPENVLLYPETPELVILFDFDSVLPKDNITMQNLSFTEKWAAPEVLQLRTDCIAETADLYTIGAFLMHLLLGRAPSLSDRRRFADWQSEFAAGTLANESPATKRLITTIFQKTLSSDPKNRFASCAELLNLIEPFIASFQKPKPYLKTFLPIGSNYFCGRNREITEIHRRLQNESRFLVLHGIGGIGKSELAKHYAMAFTEAYDAVIFMRFQGDVLHTVISDVNLPIMHCERDDDESDEVYFSRKIAVLQSICTVRHLLILDNFDTEECENLDALTALQCHLLVTSRTDFSDVFPQLEIGVMADFTSLQSIYSHYSGYEPDSASDNIIYALEGHTMAVELISKQMKQNGLSAETVYQRLCANGISAETQTVKSLKDGTLRCRSAIAHIEILFSVFDLPEEETKMLCHIAILGGYPFTAEKLAALCEFNAEEISVLDSLIKGGWVQNDGIVLQVHTLVTEALLHQLHPPIDTYWRLEKGIVEQAEMLQTLDGETREWIEYLFLHMEQQIYCEENEETGILICFYRTLAQLMEELRDYDKAEKFTLRYMELADDFYEDKEPYVYEYLDLAGYAEKQGDFVRAKGYMETAKQRMAKDVAMLMHSIDHTKEQVEYDKAKAFCFALLDAAEDDHDRLWAYQELVTIALQADDSQLSDYAQESLRYALLILEQTDTSETEEYISALGDAAACYTLCGQWENALHTTETLWVQLETNGLTESLQYADVHLLFLQSCAMLGKAQEAISHAEAYCCALEKHFTDRHPQKLMGIYDLHDLIVDIFNMVGDEMYFRFLTALKQTIIRICIANDDTETAQEEQAALDEIMKT